MLVSVVKFGAFRCFPTRTYGIQFNLVLVWVNTSTAPHYNSSGMDRNAERSVLSLSHSLLSYPKPAIDTGAPFICGRYSSTCCVCMRKAHPPSVVYLLKLAVCEWTCVGLYYGLYMMHLFLEFGHGLLGGSGNCRVSSVGQVIILALRHLCNFLGKPCGHELVLRVNHQHRNARRTNAC